MVQSLCVVVSNSTLNRNNGKILLVEWLGLSFCNTRVKTCLSFRLLAVYRVADTNPSARTLNISFSVSFAFSSVGARGIWTITVGSAVASHLVFKIVLLQRVFWGLALEKGWIVALNYEVWEQLQTGSGPAPLLLSEQCFCAVPSHCTNDRSGLLLDWLVLIPFRKGFESSNFGFITLVLQAPALLLWANLLLWLPQRASNGGSWQRECGIKNQLLNPVVLGHQWLGLYRCSGKVIVRKHLKVHCFAGSLAPLHVQVVDSFEDFGEIKLGKVQDGVVLCGMWVSCDLLDATWGRERLLFPYLLSACRWGHPLLSRASWRWDLKCLPVAVLQETLTFCLWSTSPGWVSPTVQVKVHPLSLRHCCLPQTCLLSRCIIRRQIVSRLGNHTWTVVC